MLLYIMWLKGVVLIMGKDEGIPPVGDMKFCLPNFLFSYWVVGIWQGVILTIRTFFKAKTNIWILNMN